MACLTLIVGCSGGTEPPAPVASVLVTPPTSTIVVGEAAQLTAMPRDAQGTSLGNRTVSWSSTNTAVASVSSTGMVTAVGVGGPVTIVASSEGQDGSAVVTVVPPPVATITVAPSTISLTPGAVLQLMPTLRDASGTTLSGRVVTWTTSNNGVATVSSGGLVTAVSVGGPVTVTATSEGQTGTATMNVVAPIVTDVSVSPATTSIANGSAAPLTAVIRDQNSVIMTGRIPTWTSSNASVATVSAAGMVTGVSPGGPVTITATADGKAGTAQVTITSGPCDASTAIAVGQILSGSLSSSDCALEDGSYMDQFQITVTAAGRLQFDVTSLTFDAYLILYLRNPDGTKVAVGADNNSAGGTNARITRDVVAGESYFVGANSLLSAVTGAYQVSVQSMGFFIAGATTGSAGVADQAIARSKMAMKFKRLP